MAEVNSVREPDDFDNGSGCKESLDCRQRIRAIEAIRLGLDLFDLNAGGAGDLHGNVTVGLRQRQQRNAAIVGLGSRDHLIGGAKPASQVDAAGQPSSTRISKGAAWSVVASGGFHIGPAAAMITSAASVSRRSVSHQGVRDGVSSLGAISNSR